MIRIQIVVSLGAACLVSQLAHAHGGPGEREVFIGLLVYLLPYLLGFLISGKGKRGVYAKYSLAMFVAVCVLVYISWRPGEFFIALLICALPWLLVPLGVSLRRSS